MKIRLTTTALAIGMLTSFTAYADEMSDLKAQTQLLNERLERLEKAKKEASATAAESKSELLTNGKGLNIIAKEGTQVNLYGLVDVSVGGKSNATASGRTKAGMFIGQMSASRWGIFASHVIDKASGTKAISRFEGEFETPTGKLDTANTIFNRMAYVGVESDTIGKLTIGRQNTVARDFTGVWNPYGSNYSVGYSEGGYSNNANTKDLLGYNVSRSDGAIVWKKVLGRWAVGGMYGFGYVDNGAFMGSSTQNTASQFGEGSTMQLAGAYNGDRFTVVVAGTHMLAKHLKKDMFSVGGNYKIIKDVLMVKVGYARGSAEQGTMGQRIDNAYVASFVVNPAPKWMFEGGASYIDAGNAAYNTSTLGITGDPTTATGHGAGKRFVTFGALFYKFTNQFDVYTALNHAQHSGSYVSASTNGTRNMTEYFTGVRFKF